MTDRPPRKPFSPELHAQFDNAAKLHVAHYLGRQGFTVVWEPEGPYGVDLLARQPNGVGEPLLIEVEVRPDCWKAPGVWKWKSVHVPLRKKEWAGPTFFLFALDEPLRYAVVVPGAIIQRASMVVVANKYVKKDELFVDIPLAKCDIRRLYT